MSRSHARRAFLVVLLALTPAASAAPTTAPSSRPAARDVQTVHCVDLPLNVNGATDQLAAWLKPFDRAVEAFEYRVRLVEDEDALRSYRLVYPSPVETPWPEANVVPSELYLPKAAGGGARVPGVVVLDILDGSGIIARGLARGLAERGAAALYIPMPTYGPRRPKGNAHVAYYSADPRRTVDHMRQIVFDARRAKAILAARPEVDPGKLCITGVSLGGIMTCLAAGVDGDFARVVPILAGGDVATITFHARETRRMRQTAQQLGLTRDDLAAMLAPVEPLNFASRIATGSCLMINAANDEVIPRPTTEALWAAIGKPAIRWVPSGHYSAMLYLPNIRERAIDFILGKDVGPVVP